MKKGLKSAGIVALSAVLACGAIGALAGCGKKGNGSPRGKADELTVSIFCNAADATTNQAICDQWAKDYMAEHPEVGKIRVTLANETNKANYFQSLDREWSTDSTADIIYLAPRYVRSYAENGNILDLSDYLKVDAFKEKDKDGNYTGKYLASDVWTNGLSYYGYIKGKQSAYTMGRPIKVNEAGDFVTADGDDANTKVGLYGLPKDYSNFSTGYNRVFFSDALKTAYTTTKPGTSRKVKGPQGETSTEWTSKCEYTGEGDEVCITYAADNEFGKAGDEANIINIGIPTTYKPYNFFRWSTYEEALKGRDPVAIMSKEIGGYTVTLPGFPNDPLTVDQAAFDVAYGKDTVTLSSINVPYNKEIAHVTYTYAEYGALIWVCTYYLNTFAWDHDQNVKNGYGGRYSGATGLKNGYLTIYGGEQFEGIAGTTGSVLYLLPWLAANDADLINNTSTATAQDEVGKDFSNGWRAAAGKKTYDTKKLTLADTTATKKIQYGHNSENFIETYAAFLSIGSDWNGNPAGDTSTDQRGSNGNGWGYFRTGRSLFYGAGSWDAATRNDVYTSVLDFGQMPTPVAEKYALYSKVKDASYEAYVYSNKPDAAAPGSAAEGAQRDKLEDGLKQYNSNEILANQIRRQDKWAARMDTVGYAVAAKVAKYTGEHAWKKDAAISLAARMTINKEAQKTLLYAGAQLPNFVSQCIDFVNYKTAGANAEFAQMLTPEGFYDTPAGNEKAVWDYYYKIALDMEIQAKNKSTQTVHDYMLDKKHSTDGKAGTATIRYDEAYDNVKFIDFTGDGNARIAYAMKVLRMVSYRADDRDINIRMQYGLNGVRDSSMYTYTDDWMAPIDARNDTHMLTYCLQAPLTENQAKNFLKGDSIMKDPSQTGKYTYYTPAVWCFMKSQRAQDVLWEAVLEEYASWLK